MILPGGSKILGEPVAAPQVTPAELKQHIEKTRLPTLAEIEKEAILKRIEQCCGNKAAASASLGITAKTLYTKLHQYGVFESMRQKDSGPRKGIK